MPTVPKPRANRPSPDERPTVLVVCTGNICRSPAAERLLAAALGPEVTVASAGTRAVVGHPVSAPMVPLVTGTGLTCDGFAARQLTPAMVRDAALVLTMTREHRSDVVGLEPAAVRRAFTLLELARLLSGTDPDQLPGTTPTERLAALSVLAATRRGRIRPATPADDDVADPYGLGDAAYATAFAQMQPAVEAIARVLSRPHTS